MTNPLKCLFGVLAVAAACGLPVAAAEHPVPLQKDADCASCHEEKSKGKAVHSAIAMGCTTCHEVKTEGDTTTVNLTAPKEQLCFTCHEKSEQKVKHEPYAAGNCTVCHDPHVAEHPKQLRAASNDLCLSCHALDRPDVKWDPKTKTISMLSTQTLSLEDYRKAKKIGLDKQQDSGHPMMGHPIRGLDPRDKSKKTPLSCLSCHQPHSSDSEDLMPKGIKSTTDLCAQCHQ